MTKDSLLMGNASSIRQEDGEDNRKKHLVNSVIKRD